MTRPQLRLLAGGSVGALVLTGTTLLAPSAAHAVGEPEPVCAASTCTVTFGLTGHADTFTVPANVTSVEVRVAGAQGGASDYQGSGGGGALVDGTVAVQPAQQLAVLSGQGGSRGGGTGFGGGAGAGSGGYPTAGSGGGGSFVFTAAGDPLLAAGGGGGASEQANGGAGSGASTSGGAGSPGYSPFSVSLATGGSQSAAGSGGASTSSGTVVGTRGGDGSGPAQSGSPGTGGGGGNDSYLYNQGGGGGGGLYGGGGGGLYGSGAGGSGYADPSVTQVASSDGANGGNGWVSFTWDRRTPTVALTVSPTIDATSDETVTLQATVTGGFGDPTGAVAFRAGGTILDGCAAQALDGAGQASCATTLAPGTNDLTADFTGDTTYAAGQDTRTGYQVYAPFVVTTATLPAGTFGEPYEATVLSSGGKTPSTWTVSGGALPAGLSLSSGGVLSGTPTTTTPTPLDLTVEVTDARGSTATADLTIAVAKAAQDVTFTSDPPAAPVVGDSYTPTAMGGSSGNAVTFSVAPGTTNAACSVTNGTLTFDHSGTCVLNADQAGDAGYLDASTAQQQIAVGPSAQAVNIRSAPPSGASVGGAYTVAAAGGSSGEPITFSAASGSPVCTVTDSTGTTATVRFDHPGRCEISADQAGDSDHDAAPTATQQFDIGKAAQAVTFTSTPPSSATVGAAAYTVHATGGASGNPVTISVGPGTTNAACTVTAGPDGTATVSLDHPGSCDIAAVQAGSDDYLAGPPASQDFAIALNATSTALTLSSTDVVFGQEATATATVTGTSSGSVQFTVRGQPVGAPVPLSVAGTAASGDLSSAGLLVGAQQVGAVFAPSDSDRFATSTATPQTLTVNRARTSTSVSVQGGSLAATVAPKAPGAGAPTGVVEFFVAGAQVGTATLTNGQASFGYRVPTGRTKSVAAVYVGDTSFLGSSASTARTDPSITATITSPRARSHGWYSAPVTVSFRCQATSAPLSGACPSPVTYTRDGAGRAVTRTILAIDGGAATVTVRGINIDRRPPTVGITGVRSGATYFVTVPRARCRAADALSGVASCTLSRRTHGRRVVLTATATDRAGNRTRTTTTVRTTSIVISGAAMRGGHYTVHRGHTYTIRVAASRRPRYVFAAPAPRPPAGSTWFQHAGRNRWALGVTFTASMRKHTWWNIGVRSGSTTQVLTVRVVR